MKKFLMILIPVLCVILAFCPFCYYWGYGAGIESTSPLSETDSSADREKTQYSQGYEDGYEDGYIAGYNDAEDDLS